MAEGFCFHCKREIGSGHEDHCVYHEPTWKRPAVVKLDPCPFCGNDGPLWCRVEIDVVTECRVYRMMCGGCRASGPVGWDLAGAESGWNGRVDQFRARFGREIQPSEPE